MHSGDCFQDYLVPTDPLTKPFTNVKSSTDHTDPTLLFMSTCVLPQYTHSGKKVEVAVKKVIAGEEVKERGAYKNPNSLDLYANLPQLRLK